MQLISMHHDQPSSWSVSLHGIHGYSCSMEKPRPAAPCLSTSACPHEQEMGLGADGIIPFRRGGDTSSQEHHGTGKSGPREPRTHLQRWPAIRRNCHHEGLAAALSRHYLWGHHFPIKNVAINLCRHVWCRSIARQKTDAAYTAPEIVLIVWEPAFP